MEKKDTSTNKSAGPFSESSNLVRFINKYEWQVRTLTDLEVEILTLTAKELEDVTIAEKLRMNRSTVQHHQMNIRKKLGIENKAGYIKIALAFGFIPF